MLELYQPALLLTLVGCSVSTVFKPEPSQGDSGIEVSLEEGWRHRTRETHFQLTTITKETGPMKLQMK